MNTNNKNTFKAERRSWSFYWKFEFEVEKIYPLLCARKESEWLGTNHEIVFSKSGYAEKDYVFSSSYFGFGDEVWVRYKHIENKSLAYYRYSNNLVIKFEIDLKDNLDGTVSTRWRQTFTGLNENGNKTIQNMPLQLDLSSIMKSLENFMECQVSETV